jgi:hypothetical protein
MLSAVASMPPSSHAGACAANRPSALAPLRLATSAIMLIIIMLCLTLLALMSIGPPRMAKFLIFIIPVAIILIMS